MQLHHSKPEPATGEFTSLQLVACGPISAVTELHRMAHSPIFSTVRHKLLSANHRGLARQS